MAVIEETRLALDVWLKFIQPGEDGFDASHDEEPSHEANTFKAGDEYCVEYYHTGVGLVSHKWFKTHGEARRWLVSQGFEDFSS